MQYKTKIKDIFKTKTILLFLFLAVGFFAKAQIYPVQVTPILTPPYNVTLSSYATTSSEKITLRLLMTDINVSHRQVRLKMILKGKGLNIQSQPFVIGANPIFLTGGNPEVLSTIDLHPYFELNNLLGITPQQYSRPLPDGVYTICFEVYDFITNQLISNPNTSCTLVNFIVNDPPFLNIPQRGEQIVFNPQRGINFQWTPRHINAGAVQYEFEIRELWDTQIDPQAGFLASPPLYQETTFATSYWYDIGKPSLLPDKTYAWRVRAISTTGISENSVFRNNGYSEIFYFKLSQDCDAPSFTLSEAISQSTVKITWQGSPEHNKYHIQYKKANVDDAEWFEVFTYNEQARISNLEAGVTYDFRVGGTCNSLTQLEQSYTYSNINQFTMPTEDEAVSYNCGVAPDIEITNQSPLQNIGVNETFTAGDFPVTVKEVQGSNGRFSGHGYIVVPYLADTKLAVSFEGITINTEYQLIDGVVKTTYDPNWENVVDIGGFIDGIKDLINDLKDKLNNGEELTDEEKEDFQIKGDEYYDDLSNQIDELVADGKLTQEEANTLKDKLKESQDTYNNVLGTQFASNDDSVINDALNALNDSSDKLNEVEEAINAATSDIQFEDLLETIRQLQGKGILYCKKCVEDIPDAPPPPPKFERKENGIMRLLTSNTNSNSYNPLQELDYRYALVQNNVSREEILEIVRSMPTEAFITFLEKNEYFTCVILETEGESWNYYVGRIEKKSAEISNWSNSFGIDLTSWWEVLLFKNQEGEAKRCAVLQDVPLNCDGTGNVNEIEDAIVYNIENCEEITGNDIISEVLTSLQGQFRGNQKIQFVRNGKVYQLNANNEVEEIENALTDAQIENGEWTDTNIDQIFRVHQNEDGILQFKSVGIRNNLPIFDDSKTVDLKSLSQNMKEKGNAFLDEFKVKNIDDTPQDKGANLDSDAFADGKKIAIKEDVSFFKIISEGAGKMGELLKTGKVEESTYLESTEPTEVVHAPGVVTGSTQAATRAVTDITGVVVLVYDLSVDDEARQQTWEGLKKVKDQIAEDPSTLFPILTDIIVEEATGNTPDDWAEIANEGTDYGKKSHLTSNGAVRTTMTVFTSGKLILKLPKMADDLALRMDNTITKLTKKLDNTGESFDALKNARKVTGKATGNGVEIKGKWLKGTERNAGQFPKAISDKLKGREFNNFDEFRQAFWKEVADNSDLNKQFINDAASMNEMRNGRAPFVNASQQAGDYLSGKKYILHHKTPINQGGGVYDVDNLYIVTPKFHKEILLPEYHYGYGY